VPRGGRRDLSATRHLELARENAKAFTELRKLDSPARDWAATALFYSAVHYADALLRHAGEPQAANHDERWRQLTDHVDDAFLEHYFALKALSQDWRYYGRPSTPDELDRAQRGHHKPIVEAAAKVAT
jgi:hypothetical protein